MALKFELGRRAFVVFLSVLPASIALAASTNGSASSAGASSTTHVYSGDSPEAQAIHRQLMQQTANQQQYQKQQDFKDALSDQAKIQAELKEVDAKLAQISPFSGQDKATLTNRRAQLEKQMKINNAKLKENSSGKQ